MVPFQTHCWNSGWDPAAALLKRLARKLANYQRKRPAYSHVQHSQKVDVPWGENFLQLCFGKRPSILSAFLFHPLLCKGNLLMWSWIKYWVGICRSGRTSWLRYHGLEISGTSGNTKKPLIATGREIIPSTRKSLIWIRQDIHSWITFCLTTAIPWSPLDRLADKRHP
jgi:hypothetical protein